ncbi:MAG: hypothetical protein ABEJ87_01250 [Candidatus Nanohalobium sp.]
MASRLTMMLAAVGGIAGYLAFQAYKVSELTSGLIVLFIISWFFFSMIGWSSLWNLLAFFKNPFMAALMIAGLGFTYWTYHGHLLPEASLFGTGMLFLGAAFGSWLCAYWTIGG